MRDEKGAPAVCVLGDPAMSYNRVMTRSDHMPVFSGEHI
jgi:hypothetical protein